MTYLVVVTAGRWQAPIILAARKRGIQTIAIDSDANAEGLNLADYLIVSPLNSPKGIIKEIELITSSISGVISYCSEAGMTLTSEIGKYFGLSGRQFADSQLFTNKGLQRFAWESAQILSPAFSVFSSKKKAREFLLRSTLPKVIKPTTSSGSRGVSIVQKHSQVDEAIRNAFKYDNQGEVIVEDFLEGDEYTVEVFASSGIIKPLLITKKSKVSKDLSTVALELNAVDPKEPIWEKIAELAVAGYKAIGLDWGPGHMEVMACNGTPTGIVEAAGRGGGFNLATKFIRACSGIDFVDLSLDWALGSLDAIPEVTFTNGTLFFYPSSEGMLKEIVGEDFVREITGIELEILCKIGDALSKPATDGDRLCTVVVKGPSRTDVEMKITQIRENFRFEIG